MQCAVMLEQGHLHMYDCTINLEKIQLGNDTKIPCIVALKDTKLEAVACKLFGCRETGYVRT